MAEAQHETDHRIGQVMGIDPGSASGAIAVYRSREAAHWVWKLKDMTLSDMWAVIEDHDYVELAVLERVSAMPRQGVSSTFKFGTSFGALEAFLVAAQIPYELVAPGTWQRALGCLSKGDKNVTKKKAQQLFPKLKVTHLIADALLIAEYARRLNAQRHANQHRRE